MHQACGRSAPHPGVLPRPKAEKEGFDEEWGWQQRGHPRPQVVRNKIGTHPGHPADQDRWTQDPRLNSF